MPMFWSKKPKAEKDYSRAAAPAKTATKGSARPSKSRNTSSAKSVKTVKPVKAAKAVAKAKTVSTIESSSISSERISTAEIIIKPHVTEKSGMLSQNGTYTFQVSKNADKRSVSGAIISLYKVRPVKVRIINIPARRVFVRGKVGRVSGMKKAMITLKKGEKIDFI